MQHLDFFQRDQSAAHHRIDRFEQCLDFFLGIDDLDHERQIFGEAQDFRGVQAAGVPESHGAAQHGRAAEMHFASLQDQGFVERPALPVVVFAQEDSKQNRVFWYVHATFR